MQRFLFQCSFFFASQVGTTDQQKVTQFLNSLTVKALIWATQCGRKKWIHCFIWPIHWTAQVHLWSKPWGRRKSARNIWRFNKESEGLLHMLLIYALSRWAMAVTNQAIKVAFHQGLSPKVLNGLITMYTKYLAHVLNQCLALWNHLFTHHCTVPITWWESVREKSWRLPLAPTLVTSCTV